MKISQNPNLTEPSKDAVITKGQTAGASVMTQATQLMTQTVNTDHLPKIEPITKQLKLEVLTHEQRKEKVQKIYTKLTLIEKKSALFMGGYKNNDEKLNQDVLIAFVKMHQELLDLHVDFFTETQHPNANDSVKRLVNKYDMPQRFINDAIQSPLEFLKMKKEDQHYEHLLHFTFKMCSLFMDYPESLYFKQSESQMSILLTEIQKMNRCS